MTSKERQALFADLIRDEGIRSKAYVDTRGKVTVGVGRNLTDVGISTSEAMQLLDNDVATILARLPAKLPWFGRLDPMRQRVLVNMAFNLGLDGLLSFKQMLSALKSGDYDGAADEMLDSDWAEQVKDRAIRLAQQMRTGQA